MRKLMLAGALLMSSAAAFAEGDSSKASIQITSRRYAIVKTDINLAMGKTLQAVLLDQDTGDVWAISPDGKSWQLVKIEKTGIER